MIRATAALCMVFLFCASYSVYRSQWQATVIGFHQWLWRDCHVYILEHTSPPVTIRNLSREPSRGSSLPTSLLSHPFLLYFLFTQQVSLGLRSCRHHSLLTGGYSHFTDARWLRYLQKKKNHRRRDKLQSLLITIRPSVNVPHRSFKRHCQWPWMLHCRSLTG